MAVIEIDYMEACDNDPNTQARYVTDAAEAVDQQNTSGTDAHQLGDISDTEYRRSQGFKLSSALTITAIEVKQLSHTGTPAGNWTLRIETNNAGKPSGTLANANASIVVTPPGDGSSVKGTFATPFTLNGATTYHLVVLCDNQTTNNYWNLTGDKTGADYYPDGDLSYSSDGGASWTAVGGWDLWFKVYVSASLQSYAGSTPYITQGSHSLKGIAAITDSNGKTLIYTISPPIDLSNKNTWVFDIRASRTGENIKIGLHDSGGVNIEVTPNILHTDGDFLHVQFDISGVANADKDAIDKLTITIVNADA